MIKRQNVIRVYSGKSGCMCGCNGTYSKSKVSPVVDKRNIEDTKISETHVSRVLNYLADNKGRVRYQHIGGDEWCAYIDERGDGRNNVVYYKEESQFAWTANLGRNLYQKDIVV